MVCANRAVPVAKLSVQLHQEVCCICGIFHRVEHGIQGRERRVVPFVVDLETPDVETACSGLVVFGGIGQRRIPAGEPLAFAF